MTATTKRPDRRVVKTKKAIKRAFVTLLNRKDYNKITIKDIAAEADVDRKTVYNYYSGIHEIRDEIENEFVASVDTIIEKINFNDAVLQTKLLFEIISEVVNQNPEVCAYLFRKDANSQLVRKTIFYLRERIIKIAKHQNVLRCDEATVYLISEFLAAGIMITYQNWFNSDRRVSFEELSDVLSKLVHFGTSAFKQ